MNVADITSKSDALEERLRKIFGEVARRSPSRLKQAMDYALFPGGGRVRPRMCLEVFSSLGGKDLDFAMRAAAAVEFLHCGSLVHDDLPCFDNAITRRGKPSLHVAFGESTAVLVGDGLISAAFEVVAASSQVTAGRVVEAARILGAALSASDGLVAGQAMESEDAISVIDVHRAKTGALFGASAALGALAAGVDTAPWRAYGLTVGRAYQLADDLADTDAIADLGKPNNRDIFLGRPNAVLSYGRRTAVQKFNLCLEEAIDSIPQCRQPERLIDLTKNIAGRLFSYSRENSCQDPTPLSGIVQSRN